MISKILFRKNFKFILLLTILLSMLSMLLHMNETGAWKIAWGKKVIYNFKHEKGYAYQAFLNAHDGSSHKRSSVAQLLENGINLGPANSLHDSIRNTGAGKFSFWHDIVYFSASDNSDPRVNGKRYEVYYPIPISPFLKWCIYFVTFISICLFVILTSRLLYIQLTKGKSIIFNESGPNSYFQSQSSVYRILLESHGIIILIISFLIVVIPFLITRLPYFIYYPVPSLQPDYGSYWIPLYQMEIGNFPPVFNYRTPGYPLFMGLVLLFSNKLMSIVFAQNILSLFAALTLVYSIYRTYLFLTPLAAIAIAAYISSMSQVVTDMALLTESVFTNLLIISIAMLILALKRKQLLAFILASACMALSIYVRPTGQFFIIIYVMVLFYMINNKYYKKQIYGFLLPFLLLVLLLPTYNYFTYGKFNITNGKEITLICGAQFYLEKDHSYSNELNEVIENIKNKFSNRDRAIILSTWDVDKFVASYYKNEYWDIGQILSPFSNVPEAKSMGLNNVYEKVATKSIYKNYPIFMKIYIMNLRIYFFRNINADYSTFYEGILPDAYDLLCIKQGYGQWVSNEKERKSLLREFYDPSQMNYFVKRATANGYNIKIVPTKLQKIHLIYNQWNQKYFRHIFWSLTALALCLISLIFFLFSLCKNYEAFIMLIVTSSALGHGLICSIFSNVPRFSAPTEFLYYLSVALIPILFLGYRKVKN